MDHPYSQGVCFLCGETLAPDTRSDEHVFPRWVQRKFGIRDQSIHLLNGIAIAYRKLTIPCCSDCNNGPLSELERRVQRHLAEPVMGLGSSAKIDIALWALKILYGLLYRQRATAADPRDRGGPTILCEDDLRHSSQTHLLLQGIRKGLGYTGETPAPASVAVFEVECPKHPGIRFDWRDDPSTRSIYLRLGDRGVLVSLDGGAQELTVGHIIALHQSRRLHPVQLEELGSKFLYKATTRLRSPLFTFLDGRLLFCSLVGFDYEEAPSLSLVKEIDEDVTQVLNVPNPLDDGRPLFGDWVPEHYYSVLARFTGCPFEGFPTDGGHATWLLDEDGEPLTLSMAAVPYNGETETI